MRDVSEKIDSAFRSKNIEACNWIKTEYGGRRVIARLSKRKNADRIRKNKKKLKSTDLSSWNVQAPVYIKDILNSLFSFLLSSV